jgi:phosphopentomutase
LREAFFYAGISLPPQQSKDELCAGINEEKNPTLFLFLNIIDTKCSYGHQENCSQYFIGQDERK